MPAACGAIRHHDLDPRENVRLECRWPALPHAIVVMVCEESPPSLDQYYAHLFQREHVATQTLRDRYD